MPFPAYFRFESWGHPAHLPGVPSEEFAVPAGPIMEWTLPDDDPDLHPPEILISESHDGTLRGQLIYNRHAYEAAAIADLAADFVTIRLRRDHADHALRRGGAGRRLMPGVTWPSGWPSGPGPPPASRRRTTSR